LLLLYCAAYIFAVLTATGLKFLINLHHAQDSLRDLNV
jgi:hypothetical protein